MREIVSAHWLSFPTGPRAVGAFQCSCPWHSGPIPCGEQYRDGSGHYPEAWCVECAAELPYRLTACDLAKLSPEDRPAVVRWLASEGYPRLSRALRTGTRGAIDRACARESLLAWTRRGWPAPKHLNWHRPVLRDSIRKARRNYPLPVFETAQSEG